MPTTKKPKKTRSFADVFSKYKTYDTSEGYGNAAEWRDGFAARMGRDVYEPILNKAKSGPHAILGVALNCSWEHIKSAYRKLAMQWHPDRVKQNGTTVEFATERFKEINAAYSKLADQFGR